ncbi:esterase [Mycoplasma crocodyli]|uniref:Putative esterase/lipase n=1 Tax=Mycoplasma crocodyli (strain ATCC 51981 / MP145) TaxID=512564 RepID=D5E693_MYCCM|nr:esterase [Mycoplasma crocodyli]ADE19980.1 putative esterase/lipase [Mycoplasma crocodyli MP145]
MNLKIIKYKNWKIPLFVQDNKSDSTLIAIHGINSSSDFIVPISEYKNKFNIIGINLPGSKYFLELNKIKHEDVKMDLWIEITNYVINKVKTKHNFLIAHSMSGGVACKVGKINKLEHIFFLATIHPNLAESKVVKLFSSITVEPKGKIKTTLNKGIKKGLDFFQKREPWIAPFSDEKSVWANLIKENVLDQEKLLSLNDDYVSLVKKSTLIVGAFDKVINTEKFVEYAYQIEAPVYIIGTGHSPIWYNTRDFYLFFNKRIIGKKRFLFNGLISSLDSEYKSNVNDQSEEEGLLVNSITK